MSLDSVFPQMPKDHKDSHLYMMTRREINEEYAERPVNFNAEGLRAGELLAGRSFTTQDIIVDLGSNSGSTIVEAAIESGTEAYIVCAEPDREAAEAYQRLPIERQRRLGFVLGIGESLPLRDNSVQGASLHNVIFRASDAGAMLREVRRVVEPGGFIAISSNARGHAHYRHEFERLVAEEVMRTCGIRFAVPRPPADGHYLEDIPGLIQGIGGLSEVPELYVPQDTRAIITPGLRQEIYLNSLNFSAANTMMPEFFRSSWRQAVNLLVKPVIELEISRSAETKTSEGTSTGPFFADTIIRGMFVLQKTA